MGSSPGGALTGWRSAVFPGTSRIWCLASGPSGALASASTWLRSTGGVPPELMVTGAAARPGLRNGGGRTTASTTAAPCCIAAAPTRPCCACVRCCPCCGVTACACRVRSAAASTSCCWLAAAAWSDLSVAFSAACFLAVFCCSVSAALTDLRACAVAFSACVCACHGSRSACSCARFVASLTAASSRATWSPCGSGSSTGSGDKCDCSGSGEASEFACATRPVTREYSVDGSHTCSLANTAELRSGSSIRASCSCTRCDRSCGSPRRLRSTSVAIRIARVAGSSTSARRWSPSSASSRIRSREKLYAGGLAGWLSGS